MEAVSSIFVTKGKKEKWCVSLCSIDKAKVSFLDSLVQEQRENSPVSLINKTLSEVVVNILSDIHKR